ncbi:hypothetical protein I314_01037 [Cryptococcus bacillisporus CA1873]|uniref:Mediator of RNA polymerase II transcription subunit 25 n=1 Tax=Cryptococcus bacillisporus CA1873 TaxID=1296111 RepID=A0ABR5BHH4_CRYGA|nr:hypothetical protein I314_01037 [Cryptococcus bacillisporus CA1873]|eukprot:KIR68616.1 hypothetical protein I314_01037 [Cryptococcus gattii CA1873]
MSACTVTFVFDSALLPQQYAKLAQPDGIIYKLIQRLEEKHGGDHYLHVSILITPPASPNRSIRKRRSKAFRSEYNSASTFLAALSKLSMMFPSRGAIHHHWPPFGPGTVSSEAHAKDLKRKRSEDVHILDGVVGGLELLERPHPSHGPSPSQTYISLTPNTSAPLLEYICTPSNAIQKSPRQRYLVMVSMATSGPSSSYDGGKDVSANYNWDSIWDGRSWAALERECKDGNVKCSCIITGVIGNDSRAKKIKELCEAVADHVEEAWFKVPSTVDVVLSGFAIEANTYIPPTDTASATAEPATVPTSLSAANRPDFRVLQQALFQSQDRPNLEAGVGSSFNPATLSKMDPQLIASMLTAIKAQNEQQSVGDQRWSQVQQLLEMQQKAIAAKAAQSRGKNGQGETVMAAIQQQRAQQAQASGQPTQAHPIPSRSQTIWSGAIVWGAPAGSGSSASGSVGVEAQLFSGTPDSVMVSHWPKELLLRNLAIIHLPSLTEYAKEHSCPIVAFIPSSKTPTSSTPNSGMIHYNQLSTSLNVKSNMVVIPFPSVGSDRGLLIFSAPVGGASSGRGFRLMGIVCVHVSFPPLQMVNPRAAPTNMDPRRASAPVNPSTLQHPPTGTSQNQQFRPSPILQQNLINQFNQGQSQGQATPAAQFAALMQQQAQTQSRLLQPQPPQITPQGQNPPISSSLPPVHNTTRGITFQQYQQILSHAQKLGIVLPAFDYTSIPQEKLQTLINGLKMAEMKQRQHAQVQAQQQQQQQQQQIQAQMAQMQQMMAQQSQGGQGASGGGIGLRNFQPGP